MKNTAHAAAVRQARARLAKMSRPDLLGRRALLEEVIRHAQAKGMAWRATASKEDPRLTVEEQYDLIQEALLKRDPTPGVVVNARPGNVIVITNKEKEINNGRR